MGRWIALLCLLLSGRAAAADDAAALAGDGLMRFSSIYGEPGAQTRGLRELIALVADELGPGRAVLEIGSWQGESASLLAERFALVTCVDDWAPPLFAAIETSPPIAAAMAARGWAPGELAARVESDFDARAAAANARADAAEAETTTADAAAAAATTATGRVDKLRLDARAAPARVADGSLALVYIDAAHEYEAVRDNIRDWLPKVTPDGFIGGHDYTNEVRFIMDGDGSQG